jgi:hypothetical protein
MAGQTPMPSAINPAAANNVFQQASGALTGAIGGTQAEMGFRPMEVAAQQAAGGIGTYMNPYTQQVIDLTGQDIERQRQMAMNQLGAQASAAGAFGGSRQGVAESLTNAEFARQSANVAAQLRQQGFGTALGAAQTDVANQFAAQRANQAALADASRLRLGASSQLGGLGQTAFGMGQNIINMQQGFGQQQQAMNQRLIDAARNQFGGFAGAPQASIGLPLQAVGAANMGQRTQTQSYNPGLFDYLGLGAGIGGGFF